MNGGDAFNQAYLVDVLKILESAAQQSLAVLGSDEDEELHRYLNDLRSTLVECYTTIVHGINKPQTQANFAGFAPNILQFL
jgi:hypothetical protein